MLDGRPPAISSTEKDPDIVDYWAVDCGTTPHDVKHLFVCPAHPTTMIPSDLWSRPTDAVRELSYLEARDPD